VLHLPPLRDRQGDLNPVIDHILESINKKFEGRSGWKYKKISAGARNLMHQHPWPGNIRELINTLSRATIWVGGDTIQQEHVRESFLVIKKTIKEDVDVLNRELDNGFNLLDLLGQISRHYLKRALAESHGNKTLAAKLIGLPNYQTFTNWLKKYDIKL
jgi:transcriptional regulator with PAS, ATPase and Fis domain